MRNWLYKDEREAKEDKIIKHKNNYEILENGDLKVKERKHYTYSLHSYKKDLIISKSSIISYTNNNIVFKDYRIGYNFERLEDYFQQYDDGKDKSIEKKENYIKYKETQIKTYEYDDLMEWWKLTSTSVLETETIYEKTPLEVFKEKYESKYKLIETEEEFNEYMSSTLDCDTWCRKKLYYKMKELGLGDGFISQFADLVGNDLDKYYAMIDLANEVTDKDTLMYLYTYKFGKN